ncbi:MAG: hypothetical protein HQ582_28900 [Planctomycetes bacterium]|nr:hypothetical protein [Planctomycetota bacterium]
MFFIGNLKHDSIRHEVLLTEFLLFTPCKQVRGGDVDQEIVPDATIWLNNRTIHVELETDSKSTIRVGVHKKHNDLVLWIAAAELWLERIKEETTEIHSRSLYTTVGRCTDIWDDAMGRQVCVDKLY